MSNNVHKLIELVEQNPSLPIIVLVGERVIEFYDPCSSYIKSYFSDCFISEFCIFPFYDQKKYVLKGNEVYIEEYLYNNFSSSELDIVNSINQLNWEKAIFIRITPSTDQINYFM
ncbi:MAG: hypothetical protein LBT06_08625 [Hungatella sp.]|jgi:hypothetical protein|nr:hypothetical protein [Hungatella sp.]